MNPETEKNVPTGSGAGGSLKGHLGTAGLLLTALAFNGPLGTMAGFVPLVIGMGIGAATPLVYLGVMCLMLCFAVGIVAMAKHMEKPGAFYTYVTAGMGRIPGLGAGFIAVASYMLIASGVCILAGMYCNVLVHDTLGGPDVSWSVWSLTLWITVSLVSLVNVDVSTKVLGICLILEVVIVLAWDAAVFAQGGQDGLGLDVTAQLESGSWGFALLWGAACLTGFESIQVFRAETRDAERTVPRATYATVVTLAGFYALASWAYLAAYGVDEAMATIADPTGGFLTSLTQYTFTAAADLATFLLITTTFAGMLALQNVAARYMFALGRDRVLPSWLGHAHPRFRAPTRAAATVALIVGAIWISVWLAGPDSVRAYSALTGLGNYGLIVLLTLTSLSILAYFIRHARPDTSAWKRFIAPGVALAGFVVVLTMATKNRDILIGDMSLANICILAIASLFVGGMVYAVWLRANKSDVWMRVGDQHEEFSLEAIDEAPGAAAVSTDGRP